MRVGYLLRMYPRFSQTFVVNEILELERQGVDVSILSLKKPTDGRFHESLSRVSAQAEYAAERFLESPAKMRTAHWGVFRGSPVAYATAFGSAVRHSGANLTDFKQAALVLRWAKKRKLEHVHIHFGTNEASTAYLANRMGGLPYSMTLHAFDIFRDTVDRALLARKINASRFTVTVSEYNRRFMVENLPGVNPDKIRVNYNGIDLDAFNAPGSERVANTIVGVGRLIEKKGFIHLVRAVAKLRDKGVEVRCTIVGDGPQKDLLKREIKRLDVRRHVKLAGGLSQARVRDLMAESMCTVLPCVHAKDGNVDALPTVLLEAMASGCVCVSTRVSGVPEIIEHERSGILTEPDDDTVLVEPIARILQDAAWHQQLSRRGRERAEEVFDIRRNVGRMKWWFCESIESRGASGAAPRNAADAPQDAAVSALTEGTP